MLGEIKKKIVTEVKRKGENEDREKKGTDWKIVRLQEMKRKEKGRDGQSTFMRRALHGNTEWEDR